MHVKPPELAPSDLVSILADADMDSSLKTSLMEKVRKIGSLPVPAPQLWSAISKILPKKLPFAVHLKLFERIYRDWNTEKLGPPPAWLPDEPTIRESNLTKLMKETGTRDYPELHQWSIADPGKFWDFMARRLNIQFKTKPSQPVDLSRGDEDPQWYPGARMNIVDSCFLENGDRIAVLHQKEGGKLQKTTYRELDFLSNRVAHGLVARGFKPGDRIGIAMSMNLEAVAAYLGIIKAGCVVVSIADSFSPAEIEVRLRIAGAHGIFTQDFIFRGGKKFAMYERVLAAHAPRAIVLCMEGGKEGVLREGDIDWRAFLGDEKPFPSHAGLPGDPINILFSSGTTGEPKAIAWTQTTPIKCTKDFWVHHDTHPGDVLCWPTSLGWVVGPIMVFVSLINRATLAIYDGAPTTREFGKFVEETGVTELGLVPSLVKGWRATGCMLEVNWEKIRLFSSSGESANPEDTLYLMMLACYKPMIEYCGGTEIGGCYIVGNMIHPASPAMFNGPALGIDFLILDEEGKPARNGEAFLVGPSIGLSTFLLNRDHHEVYFEGTPPGPRGKLLRRHGDQIEKLPGDFYRVHGRVDDTMNLGGIKTSSVEIEAVVNRAEGILESAAIAVPPPGGGPSLLVIYVVPRKGELGEAGTLKQRAQQAIKSNLNPLFKVHELRLMDALPRTATNKVMRRVLRDRYLQESPSPVTTT